MCIFANSAFNAPETWEALSPLPWKRDFEIREKLTALKAELNRFSMLDFNPPPEELSLLGAGAGAADVPVGDGNLYYGFIFWTNY